MLFDLALHILDGVMFIAGAMLAMKAFKFYLPIHIKIILDTDKIYGVENGETRSKWRDTKQGR